MTGIVRGEYKQLGGAVAAGQLVITVNTEGQVVRDPVGNVVFQGPQAVKLDKDGLVTLTLPASDDSTLEPSGFTYAIVEQLSHVARASYRIVEFQVTNGGTIELADLAATDEAALDPSYGANLNAVLAELDGRLSEGDLAASIDVAVTAAGPAADKIRNLLRGPTVGTMKWVSVGDSTRDEATGPSPFLFQQLRLQTAAGLPLQGMDPAKIISQGHNGTTLAAWLANSTWQAALTSANPDILEASFLTNDVRGGALGTTASAIAAAGVALLEQLIAVRDALPKRPPMILSVPASYGTGGSNFSGGVAPQVATDGVRQAYYEAARRHPDVLLYDAQTRVFGRKSLAASTYMADDLHPDANDGQPALAVDLAAFVGVPVPFDAGLAVQARAASPYAPWTVYPREVETPGRYVLVASGALVATNATSGAAGNFIDVGPTVDPAGGKGVLFTNVQLGDLMLIGNEVVAVLGYGQAQGGNSRFFLTVPATTAGIGSPVKIYRRAVPADDLAAAAVRDTSKTYKRTAIVDNAGTDYFRLAEYALIDNLTAQPVAANWAATTVAGDKIYIDGYGSNPITLTSGGGTNGALNEFSIDGSWGAYAGRLAVIVGSH